MESRRGRRRKYATELEARAAQQANSRWWHAENKTRASLLGRLSYHRRAGNADRVRELELALDAAPPFRRPPKTSGRKHSYLPEQKPLAKWCTRLLQGTRKRAQEKRLPYALNAQILLELWERQGGKCPYTGVALSTAACNPLPPNHATLDRVDSTLGYTRDNVEFVSAFYNFAKSCWSHDEVVAMAEALVTTDQIVRYNAQHKSHCY